MKITSIYMPQEIPSNGAKENSVENLFLYRYRTIKKQSEKKMEKMVNEKTTHNHKQRQANKVAGRKGAASQNVFLLVCVYFAFICL